MAQNNIFTQAAKEVLGGSKVMQGRKKLSTDEVIARYPNGVTVTEFDFIAKADGTGYPVFAIKEDFTIYFNGGALANKVATKWASLYDGDVERASDALKAAGGCRVKMVKTKTKKGQTITTFDPIDD